VHRVKVSLYGAKPPVWRRLEIPSAMPLDRVHAVLQVALALIPAR
jgi:Plasmid pRiA4b ORF-3-like protein